MFILNQNPPSKKRSRESLESDPGHACEETERSAKRKRIAKADVYTGHRPPGFWDSLSRVQLTRGALREFDRRTTKSEKQTSFVSADTVVAWTEPRLRQLKRFSRHGGPDLTHIRFAISYDQDGTMCQSTSSRKRSSASGRSDSVRKSRSSYDPNFKQNMIDGGIYPEGYELNETDEARNLAAIQSALPVPRASLSPSQFSENAFKEFKRANDKAIGETRATADVLTIIEGKGRKKYHSDGDRIFNHLEPVTEFLPIAKPDIYDGALPENIDQRVRQDLGRHIIPCNDSSRPAAPNFFIESKSASGRADVAKLQACHNGTIGARAMHSLQNYGTPAPEYDGNIKSYSNTYHPGTATLQLYGHYITPPQVPGGRPQYFMTQLGNYGMTHNSERFLEGATALRNLRDVAESDRNDLIDEANRANRRPPAPSPSTTATVSHESRPVIYEDQSDTSADELAAEEPTTKRNRLL